MASQVLVYIWVSNGSTDKASLLSSLFEDPIFQTKIIDASVPSGVDPDVYRLNFCLKDATNGSSATSYSAMLVIKDTSITSADALTVKTVVDNIISGSPYHVAYLASWLDDCSSYANVRSIPGTLMGVANTTLARGTQALLFSPKGVVAIQNQTLSSVDGTLSGLVSSGNFVAQVTLPALFQVDPTTVPADATYKTWACEKTGNNISYYQPPGTPTPGGPGLGDDSFSVKSDTRPQTPAEVMTSDEIVADTQTQMTTAEAQLGPTQMDVVLNSSWFWITISILLLILLILIIVAATRSRRRQ